LRSTQIASYGQSSTARRMRGKYIHTSTTISIHHVTLALRRREVGCECRCGYGAGQTQKKVHCTCKLPSCRRCESL